MRIAGRFLLRFLLLLAWAAGTAFTLLGIYTSHPILLSLRGTGDVVILVTSLAVVAILLGCGCWKRPGFAGWWLVLLWCLPPLSVLSAREDFDTTKRGVLRTEPKLAQTLGRHFMVGYSSFDEVAQLAEKGLIGGI